MSADDCTQLLYWAREKALTAGPDGRWALCVRNWVCICTDLAARNARFRLPNGEPYCGFFLDETQRKDFKQLASRRWMTEQKKLKKTAGSNTQISRTKLNRCSTFLRAVAHYQFRSERSQSTACLMTSMRAA